MFCTGLRSSGRVVLRASPLVVIDAISRIPVAYPATAFVGTHEQETFADSRYTLSDCLGGHGRCWWFPEAMWKGALRNAVLDPVTIANQLNSASATVFCLRHCAFLWARYALGRWTAAVAPESGDKYGFLLNITNSAVSPDRPDTTYTCLE